MTTRVLVVDDQALVRAGFRVILEAYDDFEVVAEAGGGHEAVELAKALRPDVVLMDIRMTDGDGIEATGRITAMADAPRVLILTTFDIDEYVYDALRNGASGFLLKDAPPEQLVEAVRVVARGDALLAPSVTRRLIADFAHRRPALETAPGLAELTSRERDVLILIARGLSNSEIATTLVLGSNTVKTHVNRVFMKLSLRDRAQAVVLAYESGLVEPGSTQPQG
jgi:DNA-binding NarL/FixJ family response regulator